MKAPHASGAARPSPLPTFEAQSGAGPGATPQVVPPTRHDLAAAVLPAHDANDPNHAGLAQRAAAWSAAALHSVDATGRVDMQPSAARPASIPSQALDVLARQAQSLGAAGLRELAVSLDPADIGNELAQVQQWAVSQPGVEALELTFTSPPVQPCVLDLRGMPDRVRSLRFEPSEHLKLRAMPGLACMPTRPMTPQEQQHCTVRVDRDDPDTWERVTPGVAEARMLRALMERQQSAVSAYEQAVLTDALVDGQEGAAAAFCKAADDL